MIAHKAPLSPSGVATRWTGVDMSLQTLGIRDTVLETLVIIALYKSTFTIPLPYHTPLLLEVAPETDTNPTSFYRGEGGVAPPPDPRYRLALRAHHVRPPHIFNLATSPRSAPRTIADPSPASAHLSQRAAAAAAAAAEKFPIVGTAGSVGSAKLPVACDQLMCVRAAAASSTYYHAALHRQRPE